MVSVIIPTHRGAPVDRCVKSVRTSDYKDIQIVVVDEGKERSVQRNMGIARAMGKYLLFLDSDMMVSASLIRDCIFKCEYEGYDALYLPEILITKGWFGRLRRWERHFYTGTAVDCVRFVRASLCPGFAESLHGPEDSDWDRRMEGKRGVAGEVVFHADDIGVRDYFKKKAYYAKSMDLFREKWPKDKVLNFRWRCFTVFMEDGKWKRLLKRPHYAIAVYIILFVRGIVYICAKKS